MPPQPSVTKRPEPSSSARRKRDTKDDWEAQDAGQANDTPSHRPKKAARTASSAKPKTTTAASVNKDAKKLYTDTLKAVDKRVTDLDKKVKVMNGSSKAITTATYPNSVRKHIPAVKRLITMDKTVAFNLLLSMADASHTDLDATCKMCGVEYDDSTEVFEQLDDLLVSSIEAQENPTYPSVELPEVPKRWTRRNADVGEFKTGRPNKQQRNQVYVQKPSWEKTRRQAKRERREETEDWVKVALSDLVEERDYLDTFGVTGYLPRSITNLEYISYNLLLVEL
ncbi:hypothetical protein FZEAL_270 [Fusarium zealandicum]|uniref:Uncharacterized protein n=1 Tax=Fusarium zealandicum TaxID=1053134 RepID=A0A8H4UVU1_9HYPO|nr:hypothetical protein FZEAL_270 [Fusarium zealandicum]